MVLRNVDEIFADYFGRNWIRLCFFFEFVGGIRFVESLAKKKGEKTLAYRVLSSDSGSKRSISLQKSVLGKRLL